MTLKVIGPGFGRTGAKSLEDALEQLRFGGEGRDYCDSATIARQLRLVP